MNQIGGINGLSPGTTLTGGAVNLFESWYYVVIKRL